MAIVFLQLTLQMVQVVLTPQERLVLPHVSPSRQELAIVAKHLLPEEKQNHLLAQQVHQLPLTCLEQTLELCTTLDVHRLILLYQALFSHIQKLNNRTDL